MKKWLLVLIPLLILGGLIGWRFLEKKKEAPAPGGGQRQTRSGMPASVELTSAEIRDIVNTFEATGTVEAIQQVKISPKITGSIDLLKVREGDRVTQGQVLVRIDQSAVQAEVRQQQAALAAAKYRLAQAKLTQSTTDSAVTTQIRQQRAAVESAESDLRQVEKTREAQLEAIIAAREDAKSKVESAEAVVNNAKANVDSAQASLDLASAKFERLTELHKKGYVATQEVDAAKAALSVQQAAVKTANGQVQSAVAALNSAKAQQRSVEQQGNVTRAKADADVEAAKQKVIQANAALDYANANAQQTPAYEQNLEALSAQVAVAQATLDSARAKMEDTVLRSPLDGVVTARSLDPGAMASPGQAILTVQAMNKVWVTIAVPEDVSAKLHLNQPATVTFDALGGKSFNASIAQINPSADLQSRQYTVRVILDNRNNTLTAGMFARVSLVTDKAERVLAVPREAVQTDKDGSSFVFISGAEDAAERRTVVTGVSDAKWIAILSGLEKGVKVVTMSASPLREGQKLGAGRRGEGGREGGQREGGGREGLREGGGREGRGEGQSPSQGETRERGVREGERGDGARDGNRREGVRDGDNRDGGRDGAREGRRREGGMRDEQRPAGGEGAASEGRAPRGTRGPQ